MELHGRRESHATAPLYFNNNDTPYLNDDDFVDAEIVGAPANGQLYGIPNDIRYSFSDSERERVNGQFTLQYAPVEGLTLTADYTYALVNLTEDRGEQTIWLQRNGFDYIEFDTNEAVATPVVLHEFTGASKDYGYEQQHREQENELKSVGFNANWEVSEDFTMSFDFHDSSATSMPDDGITGGGETAFSVAGKVPSTCLESYAPNPDEPTATIPCRNASNFWTQTFNFNNGLPVARTHVVSIAVRSLCGHGRKLGLQFRGREPGLAGPAHRVPGSNYRHQAVAHRRQVRHDRKQHVGVRRRNPGHGFAATCFRVQHDAWATGAWATAAPYPTWWR